MTRKETLAQLKSLGDEKVRAHNKKFGAGDNQFDVKLGDVRKLPRNSKPIAIGARALGHRKH